MRIVKKSAPTVTVTKATLMGLMVDVTPAQNKQYRFSGTEPYLRLATEQGGISNPALTYESLQRPQFLPNQVYTQAQIDRWFVDPSITTITPSTALPIAGGTVVVIKGGDFGGVTGVTFGGTAGTAFSVVNDTTINVTTPAKAAGTYDVALVGAPSGVNPTKVGGSTFV